MTRLPRASHALAATALAMSLAASAALVPGPASAASAGLAFDRDPGWREAADMTALVAHLEDWLDSAVALPRRPSLPAIRIISRERAHALAGSPARGLGGYRGLYDAQTATIFLVAPWSPDRAEDVAVLLHELVHHRQAARHWYCGAAQEPQAYHAQAAWLADRGRALDWPELAVTLAAGCTPADIHPE